jgi:hypothetical protein
MDLIKISIGQQLITHFAYRFKNTVPTQTIYVMLRSLVMFLPKTHAFAGIPEKPRSSLLWRIKNLPIDVLVRYNR